jgi:hypothetical protein
VTKEVPVQKCVTVAVEVPVDACGNAIGGDAGAAGACGDAGACGGAAGACGDAGACGEAACCKPARKGCLRGCRKGCKGC